MSVLKDQGMARYAVATRVVRVVRVGERWVRVPREWWKTVLVTAQL